MKRSVFDLYRALLRESRHPDLAEFLRFCLFGLAAYVVLLPFLPELNKLRSDYSWPGSLGSLVVFVTAFVWLRRRLSRIAKARAVKEPAGHGPFKQLAAGLRLTVRLPLSYRGYRWIDLPILAALFGVSAYLVDIPLLRHMHTESAILKGFVEAFLGWITVTPVWLLYNWLSIRLFGATPGIILWGEKERFEQEFGARGEGAGESGSSK